MTAPPPSTSLSALYGTIAIAVLTGMDAIIKAVSTTFAAGQILWLRYALTTVMAGTLLLLWRQAWPKRATLPYHLLRASLMIVSNFSFIYALGKLALAEVFALTLTAPIFLAVFGALILKEPFTGRTVLGLALGFLGTLVIVFTDATVGASARPPLALLAAMVSPVVYALSIVLLRHQATGEAPVQVVFVQSALVAAMATLALPFATWPAEAGVHWLELLALGVTSTAGYLLLVKALAGLTAVRYSVIEYTGLVWAAIIGWLIFSERPTLALWLGAAAIVAGALVSVMQREAAKA